MYNSFTAANFRCFQEISLDGLERVNLITGKNNVGKTVLLEALWLCHGYQNPVLGVTIDKFRGLDALRKDDFLRNIFFDFDSVEPIHLSTIDSDGHELTLRITITQKSVSSVSIGNGANGEKNPDLTAIPVNERHSLFLSARRLPN